MSGVERTETRQRRNLLVAVGTFYAISAAVYLPTSASIAGISIPYFVSQILSVLFLIPLLIWYRSKAPEFSTSDNRKTLRRVVLGIVGLYVLAMSVRIPAVAFLGFPLEKTPLIYLVVLTLLLVERRPIFSHGFSRAQLRNQLGLGLFLLFANLLLPVLVIVAVVAVLYGANILAGYSIVAVFLALPFQVFAVGISEEGFFRGYMQTKLSQVTGVWRAILFQASLFGVWHFVWHINPLDLIGMVFHVASTFVFGILTGTYFRYSNSIAGLVLFHGLSNSLAEGLSEPSSLPISQDILLAVFGIVELVTTVLLVVFAGRISWAFRVRTETQPKLRMK